MQGFGKLIRAGCGFEAALDALDAGDGLVHVHALHKPGNSLGVSGAAPYELYGFDSIAVQLYVDELGTDALWSELYHDRNLLILCTPCAESRAGEVMSFVEGIITERQAEINGCVTDRISGTAPLCRQSRMRL